MIDIHLHILPGVDDGPQTIEESLALANALVQEGVHTAVATPHYNDEFPHYPAAEIQKLVNRLQQEFYRYRIPLQLLAGHEVLIKPGLIQEIRAGKIATLNGSRYLLLELWNTHWLPETERAIFELRAHGLIPVLAHPERYRAIQKEPERLAALVRQGVIAQLTANSLVGTWGRTAQRCAETLLKKGLIHCIASDGHSLQHRPLRVNEGLKQAAKLVGATRVLQLIEGQPRMILGNQVNAGLPNNSLYPAYRNVTALAGEARIR